MSNSPVTPTPSVLDQAMATVHADQNPTPSSVPSASSTFSGGSVLDQALQAVAQDAQAPTVNDPRKTGEIVNDVGNKVIVPKGWGTSDEEPFSETLKRAVAYHKSLTPAQQQAAIDKETATMPKKTAQTLGAAATIGVVGPAMLAAPGELAEAVPSVLTHPIEGVKAIGTWAAKNPVQAYLLYQVMKDLIPGAKKAMGVIKGAPEVE